MNILLKLLCCIFITIVTPSFGQEGGQDDTIRCDDSFKPVCSADGNTFANKCFAELAGAEIISDGVCLDPSMQCGTAYNPVCGIDNKTYDNACIATVFGIEISRSGVCGGNDGCTFELDPVCGLMDKPTKIDV